MSGWWWDQDIYTLYDIGDVRRLLGVPKSIDFVLSAFEFIKNLELSITLLTLKGFLLTYQTAIFYLLFACPTSDFGSLSRGQPHLRDANLCALADCNSKVTRSPR